MVSPSSDNKSTPIQFSHKGSQSKPSSKSIGKLGEEFWIVWPERWKGSLILSTSLNWIIENVGGEKITECNVMLEGTDCFITLFPGSGRVCGTLVDIDKYFVKKKKIHEWIWKLQEKHNLSLTLDKNLKFKTWSLQQTEMKMPSFPPHNLPLKPVYRENCPLWDSGSSPEQGQAGSRVLKALASKSP